MLTKFQKVTLFVASTYALFGCAVERDVEVLDEYREVQNATVLSAPEAGASRVSPESRETAARGKYLVELLGCGACHTDGALVGEPDTSRALAGSTIGIAFSNPLGDARPGIVYAPNLTPDAETGIGDWSDAAIAAAIRAGQGRHGSRRIAVMPWQSYAKLTAADTAAIVAYLRTIEPIRHQVPTEVPPGRRANTRFVYFGVYERR